MARQEHFDQGTTDAMLPGFEPTQEDLDAEAARRAQAEGEENAASGTPSMYMFPEALESAIKDNKFKNMFESGMTGNIGGVNEAYRKNRVEAEKASFGIPEDAGGEDRPVYGALRPSDAEPTPGEDLGYGSTVVDFKPVKPGQRVTTTRGDSLNNFAFREAPIKSDDYQPASDDAPEDFDPTKHVPHTDAYHDYRELQFHDRPVPREDIAQVQIPGAVREGPYGQPDGRPDTGIDEAHARAAEQAQKLRDAGLSPNVPVVSSVQFSEYQPSLFEDLPQVIEHKPGPEWSSPPTTVFHGPWKGEMEYGTDTRNV